MAKSFELVSQVTARFSQLHQAINEIRETKSQLAALHKRFGDVERLKPALAAADEMEKKMSAIEEKLIQVNMKSTEGNLVYPNELNEQFYTFSLTVEADAAPTEPQLEIFKMLDGQLEEQLKTWAQIKTQDVPKINGLIKQADLPALTVTTASPSPAPPASPSPSPVASSPPN
jgi:DNA repair exonuclease SbcCD ATPase subunit